MKLKMYSVLDNKAGFFGTPFFMQKDAIAIRAFGDMVNDEKTSLNKHPEDYSLYYLGEFDDDNGSINRVDKPMNLVTAVSLLKNTKQLDLFTESLLDKSKSLEKVSN